jgi:hypothetical protein
MIPMKKATLFSVALGADLLFHVKRFEIVKADTAERISISCAAIDGNMTVTGENFAVIGIVDIGCGNVSRDEIFIVIISLAVIGFRPEKGI